MEEPPSAPKQISILSLLLPLVSILLAASLWGWQMRAAQKPVALPEISAAVTSLQAKNVEQARQKFEKLLATSPDSPALYIAVMEACGSVGRMDLACYYGERAIQACRYAPTPARVGLYEKLSECYSSGHEPAPQPRATEYARRALELAPDDPTALNSLGYTLAENVQTEAEANIAIGYLNRALSILHDQAGVSPEMLAQTEDSYGWALYKRGRFHAEDYAHAADALRQAIDDLPPDGPAGVQKIIYTHLGVACHAAGQIEEARHALEIALVYDPQDADARKEINFLPPPPSSAPASPAPATSAPDSSSPDKQTAAPQASPANSPSVTTPPHPAPPAVPTQTSSGGPIFKPLNDPALK